MYVTDKLARELELNLRPSESLLVAMFGAN